MNLFELVKWQNEGYERFHATRANLAAHIVLVPAFLLGNVALFVALWHGNLGGLLMSGAVMALAMALQGRGHSREPIPAVPFSDWQNALARIFLEQWLTFPRFVRGGGFLRAWRSAAH